MKKMNRLLSDQLEDYIEASTTPISAPLQQLLDHTIQTHSHPNMISSQVSGMFLSFISKLIRPRRILEIGTFTGFSALCMAEGLKEDGLLYTIELRADDAAASRKVFDESPYGEKIKSLTGNALEIIPTLNEEWDMVFIDADKVSYIEYYELTLPKLSRHGVILADNVLYHGDVVNHPVKGKNAKAIVAFNTHVANDSRSEQVMLSVRDGISLIRKL